MKMAKVILVAVAIFSFFIVDLVNADSFTPRGGFLIGRLAAKKIKKMREQENFSGHDTNKDGMLDKKELESAKTTHGDFIDDTTFKKIDGNGDGLLSHEECEKYQKEMEKAEPKSKESEKPSGNSDTK